MKSYSADVSVNLCQIDEKYLILHEQSLYVVCKYMHFSNSKWILEYCLLIIVLLGLGNITEASVYSPSYGVVEVEYSILEEHKSVVHCSGQIEQNGGIEYSLNAHRLGRVIHYQMPVHLLQALYENIHTTGLPPSISAAFIPSLVASFSNTPVWNRLLLDRMALTRVSRVMNGNYIDIELTSRDQYNQEKRVTLRIIRITSQSGVIRFKVVVLVGGPVLSYQVDFSIGAKVKYIYVPVSKVPVDDNKKSNNKHSEKDREASIARWLLSCLFSTETKESSTRSRERRGEGSGRTQAEVTTVQEVYIETLMSRSIQTNF